MDMLTPSYPGDLVIGDKLVMWLLCW